MNKKHVFKESHMFFMASTLSFIIFNEILILFSRFLLKFWSPMESFTKSAVGFLISIKEAIQCFDWTANGC